MNLAGLILVSFLFFVNIDGQGLTGSYSNCIIISDTYSAKLYWTVEGNNIKIGIVAASPNGWFAVGISEDGSMDSGGRPNFSDAWVTGINPSESKCTSGCVDDLVITRHGQPDRDGTQNIDNIKVSTDSTMLYSEFTRALDTGDVDDKVISLTSLSNVIWATNPTNPIKPGGLRKHTDKGSFSVNFGAASTCDPPNSLVTNKFSAGSGAYEATWNVTGEFIDITVKCQTTGWAAFGVSNTPGMVNGDIVVAWVVDATNELVIYDSYATDYIQPTQDTTQGGTNDIISSNGTQSGGYTTFSYRRKLISADTKDVSITDKTLYILYAFAATDGRGTQFGKHTTRGTSPMNFISGGTGNTTGGNTTATTGGIDPTAQSYSSPDGIFTLHWEIVDDIIHYKIQCKTTGWCAMGINSAAQMAGADMAVGWVVDADQSVVILDSNAVAESNPPTDVSSGGTNDLLLTNGTQVDGLTSITFRRKLVTGDSHDQDVVNSYQYLLYAYSSDDGSNGFYSKHSTQGTIMVNFYTGSSKSAGLILTPAIVLTIVMFCLLVAWGVSRFVYFLIMYNRKRIERDASYYSVTSSSPDMEERDDTALVSMQPSPRDQGKRFPSVREKSLGIFLSNYFHGVRHHRLYRTDIPIYAVVAALAYIGLNIGCLFVEKINYAKAFGSLIAANALLATIPAQRNSILVVFTGVPFDKAIMFHRWMGRWVVTLATIHMIYTFVQWENNGLKIADQLKDPIYIYGLCAWLILMIMGATAYPLIRRKFFEVFYFTHFIFIAFFVLGALHMPRFVPFAIASAVFYGIDRIFRMLYGMPFSKTVSIKITNDQVIQVRWRKSPIAKFLRRYQPGQYVFLQFPQVSLTQWHPFSVSSGPDELTGECNIRALGGFTRDLWEKAKEKQELLIRVDGPYGNLNINYRRFPVLMLISGGIGFTPVLGMLKDIYRTGNHSKDDVAPRSCIQDVYVIWTIQSADQYDWFSSELDEIQKASHMDFRPRLHLKVYVTRSEAALDLFTKGRPKFEEIMDAATSSHAGKAISVFVCGPSPMVQNVWDLSAKKSRAGYRIHFHHETFEL